MQSASVRSHPAIAVASWSQARTQRYLSTDGMSLATITRHGPEISDAIVSFDPVTLQRKPVKKIDVLDQFRELRNHEAVRIVQQIPERDGVLDAASVDKILITSHCEMQRMSEEFQ